MTPKNLLEDKRILIVDDERDVLATLTELLAMCHITTASTFEEARRLLEENSFDIAILDIMGVNGYRLLEVAKKKGIISVMLTAHALTVEDTVKSFKKGAASYLPKYAMPEIATFLRDILEAKDKGRNFWWRWLERFENYYDRKFGPDWKNKDKDFWDKFNFPT